MSIILRSVKGSALTSGEVDNNFQELDERVDEKQDEIGYTPVNKAGDTMSGDLSFADTKGIEWTNASITKAGGNVSVEVTAGGALNLSAANISVSGATSFDSSVNLSSLTASRVLELDGSKNIISAAKGTAYNKDFGTGTTNVPEIGSTLGNLKSVETDSSGKLITADKIDASGTPASEKLKLQHGGAGYDWTNGMYTGSNTITGTKGGEVFPGQDATSLVYYMYFCLQDNVWYRTVRS